MKHLMVFLLSVASVPEVFSQCVLETGFTGSGMAFLPAELDTVESCYGCGTQERVISLRTLTDTTLYIELNSDPNDPLFEATVYADRLRLDSIAGLPAGLSYTTNAAFDTTYDAVENPFGYWVNAGDTASGFTDTIGCITISGTEADWAAAVGGGPNNDGAYPLSIYIDVRAATYNPVVLGNTAGFYTWLSEMDVALLDIFGDPNITMNGIEFQGPTLYVKGSALGIKERASSRFASVMNRPNPFTGTTQISFEVNDHTGNVQFAVYDVLGTCIHTQTVSTSKGLNTISFSADGMAAGIYVYTLSDGTSFITKKMNVR